MVRALKIAGTITSEGETEKKYQESWNSSNALFVFVLIGLVQKNSVIANSYAILYFSAFFTAL